jgi:hypothetical protein
MKEETKRIEYIYEKLKLTILPDKEIPKPPKDRRAMI